MRFLLCCLALPCHQTHAYSANSHSYDANMMTKIASSVAKTERRHVERSRVAREVCDVCSRPPPLCVCESLPERSIHTATEILILQHPRERRRKSLSTVPLMPLVLEKCTIKVGYSFLVEELDLVTECLETGKKPLLLFPGPDAISLDDEDSVDAVKNLQAEQNTLLILIDGTWSEARGVLMRSPELVKNCQQVQFQSAAESLYPAELRKEPQKHCLSTLESCAHALMHLESSPERAAEAKESLEKAMRCMVKKRINVSEFRNRSDPRFSRSSGTNSKTYAKNKRRHEIKKQMFR